MGSKYQRNTSFFQNVNTGLIIVAALTFGFFLGYLKFKPDLTCQNSLNLLSVDDLCAGHTDDGYEIPDNYNLFQWHRGYWETHALPHVQKIAESQGYVNVLELGIMAGSSTKWILEKMVLPYPGSTYIGIDDFQRVFRPAFCKNVANLPNAREKTMMKSMTLPALIEIAGHVYHFRDRESARYGNPKLFDFIYVDDGHSGSEIYYQSDLAHAWSLLRKGGMMVLDDYDLIDYWTPASPKLVMDPFLAAYKDFFEKYWIAENQVYIIKAHDAIFGNAMYKNQTL